MGHLLSTLYRTKTRGIDRYVFSQGIYPLHDVHIRKVKVIRRPRFDLTKLMDMHGEGSAKAAATTDPATGETVERPEGYEPPVMEAV